MLVCLGVRSSCGDFRVGASRRSLSCFLRLAALVSASGGRFRVTMFNAMGVGGAADFLKESMESHSRMGSPEVDEKTAPSDAMASVASYASAPAPACFGEADAPSAAPEEESDPAYSPTIVELGLRKLPEGLGLSLIHI